LSEILDSQDGHFNFHMILDSWQVFK